MGQESLPSLSDRPIQQAIVALKKGAHLLKYGRRGKSKFCPFRLSMDERFLVWYSGPEEKKLQLSKVTNIIHGHNHNTKQVQVEKESHCLSLVYGNGKSSLELICKDEVQAEWWFIGLRAVISRNHCNKQHMNCISSPVAFMRRKSILSEVHSPPSPSSCDAMSCSSAHIFRDVYIWGAGASAQSHLPKLLHSPTMLDARSISLGKKHAAIVTEDGQVFCWGEARMGRLGHRVDMDAPRPKIVDSFHGVHVAHVSCGTYQTCALTLSGEVYTWGDNYAHHWLPHRLAASLKNVTVSNVSCGEWHSAIVSVCGRLFTYGDGTFGALGHGDVQTYSSPKQVDSIKGLRVKTAACGPWHTAAVIDVTVDCGKLFTWGDSDKGRLGHRDQERKLVPTYVAELLDHNFVRVSCGDTLTVGLTNTGRVFTIGSAVYGQLGIPQGRDKSIVAVKGRLIDELVVEISSGSFHVAVLTSKGNVYTWGRGENGQLGLGDTKDRSSPSLVDALKGRQVEKVTCGSTSTAAICASMANHLACRGCGNAFGFTRKKQNCYNCGRLFCRACSSRRSMNASFRVCNDCFNELQSVSDRVALETMTQNGVEGDEDRRKSVVKGSYDGDRSSKRKDVTFIGDKSPQAEHVWMDKVLPRWGHVSCPQTFTDNYRDAMMGKFPGCRHAEEKSSAEKHLSQEILKLKAQVDSLEKLCETREEKIQENKTKIEQVRSLREEEATNFKDADELIQILTSKLCQISEKISCRQEAKEKGGFRSHSPPPVAHRPSEALQLEDSSGSSPIVYSSKLTSLCGGATKFSKVEWVDQYETGVFITFTALPDGQTGLRRIRFSRNRFNEREAKIWWEENQQTVCRNYGIHGSAIPNG